ncbi:MAG: hypothetical protein JOZ69_24725 [Myxococcales bacterium]|nr:hypothetical protein [Myxococcales bacterium]
MLLITAAIAMPIAAAARRFERLHRILGAVTGLASDAFGAVLVYDIGSCTGCSRDTRSGRRTSRKGEAMTFAQCEKQGRSSKHGSQVDARLDRTRTPGPGQQGTIRCVRELAADDARRRPGLG